MNKVDIKGKATLELSDGLLYLRWNREAYIGIDVARAALEAISTLCQGARLPMLVEIQGVTHSGAARKLFPDPANISRMALVGDSPRDRVIAMLRLSLLRAGFPIKYFTSRDQAIIWLKEPTGEQADSKTLDRT